MLSKQDQELIAAATEAIKRRYRNDWQEVGAAFRTRDGRIYTGVNLDAYLGRMAVCAEAVALGRAITESGETGIDTIVAVRHPEPTEPDQTITVVSPCGSCRELIWDYDPQRPHHRAQHQRSGHRHHRRTASQQVQPGADPLRIVH
jgi:cytidine deaminase